MSERLLLPNQLEVGGGGCVGDSGQAAFEGHGLKADTHFPVPSMGSPA